MSTGISVEGGEGNSVSWNLTIGSETGISLKNSSNNILAGNIHIDQSVVDILGEEFIDVARAVQQSRDYEALAALAEVVASPSSATSAWSILITKFSTNIGRFNVDLLKGVLSAAAWDLLKIILKQHGISF